jgi:hypothetical protein
VATETSSQPEKPSRKWAVLWLLIVLVYPFVFNDARVMGMENDWDSKSNTLNVVNHRLGDFMATFYGLALLCAVLLLFWPRSNVFWLCSIGLMVCVALTQVVSCLHLRETLG